MNNRAKFLKLVSKKDTFTVEKSILRLYKHGKLTDIEAISKILDFQKTKKQ